MLGISVSVCVCVCVCVCVFRYVYFHYASFLSFIFLVGLRSIRLSFFSCYFHVSRVFYLVLNLQRSFLFVSFKYLCSFVLPFFLFLFLVSLAVFVSCFFFLFFFFSFYFIRPNLHLHTTKLSRVSKIRINRLLLGVDTVLRSTIAIVRNTS